MNQLRVSLPPCTATGFGAEFSFFVLGVWRKALPAMAADHDWLFFRYAGKVVAPTKALDRILGNAEAGGYGAIAQPLAAKVSYFFFFHVSHNPPP